MIEYLNEFIYFIFFALILFAALSDASSFRIPNVISIALVALFPFHVLLSPAPVDWLSAIIVAVIAFAVGFIMFTRGWLGGGDVKLVSATLLWAGSALAMRQLLVMAFAGGILALIVLIVSKIRHRAPDTAAPRVPYGVAIAAGAGYAGIKLLLG